MTLTIRQYARVELLLKQADVTGEERENALDMLFAETVRVSDTTQLLIDQLIRRDQLGQAKYGTSLDRTDLTHDQWLQHMVEECLDAAGYAAAAIRTNQPEDSK